MKKETDDQLLAEMRSVKMLLILQLLKNGAKHVDIARMLGISKTSMSRLVPKEVKASLKGQNFEE